MAEKVSTRVAVGLAMLVALLGLLGWDHASGKAWGLGFLVLLMVTWGAREIAKLLRNSGAPVGKGVLMTACAVLVSAKVLGHELAIPALEQSEEGLLVLFAFAVLFPPLLGTPSKEVFLGVAGSLFGIFYVWYLGSYVLRLRYLPEIGEAAAFYAILVSKGSDVFAYFTGKTLGRTKLIVNISPGKTTAGFVGALVGAVLITAGFSAFTSLGTALPLRFCVPVGIVLGLVSIAGDLVESLFKRSADLKDSARLLPTFGGILDVIDSILTSAPATFWLLALIRPWVQA